jgi:hypothetical protein
MRNIDGNLLKSFVGHKYAEDDMSNKNDEYEQEYEFTPPQPTGKKFVSEHRAGISCVHNWVVIMKSAGGRFCRNCGATCVIENDKLVEYDATACFDNRSVKA